MENTLEPNDQVNSSPTPELSQSTEPNLVDQPPVISSPPSSPSTVSMSAATNSWKIASFILALIVLGASGLALYFWQKSQTSNQVVTEPTPTVQPTPLASSAVVTSPLASASTTSEKTLVHDSQNRFSFNPAANWTTTSKILKPGESLKEADHYDITATDSSVEVIMARKPNWLMQIEVRNKNPELGGFGPIENLGDYKQISALDRTILRSRVEDGILPFIGGDASEGTPRPIPILFQRKPGETTPPSWPKADGPNSYLMLFTTNSEEKNANVSIAVYSPLLTDSNITNKKIDPQVMAEVDQMLASMKFSP